MKNGGISNKVSSPNIGIRLNDLLVEEHKVKFFKRIKSIFTGQVDKSALNIKVIWLLNLLFHRTSMTVDLVIIGQQEDKYKDAVQNLPHNNLWLADSLYDVEALVRSGTITYFVTTPSDVEKVGNEWFLTLSQFNSLLAKGLKRI